MRSAPSFVVGTAVGFLIAVAAPACGPAGSPRCLRSNCSGCCDSNGRCQPGTASSDCGNDGGMCAICGSGQSCNFGTCGLAQNCGPGNCSGCCIGATCVSPPTDSQCGVGGGQCVACNTGQTC